MYLQFSLHDIKISKGSILLYKHKSQILLSSEIRLIPLSLSSVVNRDNVFETKRIKLFLNLEMFLRFRAMIMMRMKKLRFNKSLPYYLKLQRFQSVSAKI